VACAGLALGAGVGLARVLDGASHSAPRQVAGHAATVRPATHSPGPRLPRGSSLVARSRARSLTIYRRPIETTRGARRIDGGPSVAGRAVLLVAQRRPGWVQVWLPSRPNGSRGWVRAHDVALARDDWSLEVRLASHRLIVRRRGEARWRMEIADGAMATPTPAGRFFITELLRQPARDGLYGPWAFGLSAHSQVLRRFNGGNGEIGIHGTDQPSLLGRSVSHGCIRLANRDIRRLARVLPLGTPVRVRAS
jgi:L,D-transpeptidase catalytic domain